MIKGLGPGGAERLLVAAATPHDRERFTFECAYVLPWKDHLAGELEAAGVRTHCLSTHATICRWPPAPGDADPRRATTTWCTSTRRCRVRWRELAVRSMRRRDRPGLVTTEHNRWETHRLPTRWLNRLTSRWDDAHVRRYRRGARLDAGPGASGRSRCGTASTSSASPPSGPDRRACATSSGIGPDELVIGHRRQLPAAEGLPEPAWRGRGCWPTGDVPVRLVAVGQGPQEAEIASAARLARLGDRRDHVHRLPRRRHAGDRRVRSCSRSRRSGRACRSRSWRRCALGLPIVATAVGGMAEEFTDGVDALLVPPATRRPGRRARAGGRPTASSVRVSPMLLAARAPDVRRTRTPSPRSRRPTQRAPAERLCSSRGAALRCRQRRRPAGTRHPSGRARTTVTRHRAAAPFARQR